MRLGLLTAVFCLTCSVRAHAATDTILPGSASQAFMADPGSTHVDVVAAATQLEDVLWPRLAANLGTVQATVSTRFVHGALHPPANLSATGQAQRITTAPYGVQTVDLWDAQASVGYSQGHFSVYYAGSFVGAHSAQLGAAAYPFAAAGLMGLGALDAVAAPLTGAHSLRLGRPFGGSAAHYVVGTALHAMGTSLRVGVVGGGPVGFLASLIYEPWNVSATLVNNPVTGSTPYARFGLIHSSAIARAVWGDDVGACPPNDHCTIAPLTSVYARRYALSAPQAGLYPLANSPTDASLWTLHAEQANIPLPLGWLDVRFALAVDPAVLVHEATLGWHTATYNGGRSGDDYIPPLDVGITLGMSQMPALLYASNTGRAQFTWAIEARWGTWLGAGIRHNAADTLALYPFATGSTEVFVTVGQDAFTP